VIAAIQRVTVGTETAATRLELMFPDRGQDQGYGVEEMMRFFGWATSLWAVCADLEAIWAGERSQLAPLLLAIDHAHLNLIRTRERVQAEEPIPLGHGGIVWNRAVIDPLWRRVDLAADQYNAAIAQYLDHLKNPPKAALSR
jgi:hypothetical protein